MSAPRCREQPCETCPYRRDVPSGLWGAHEYNKLPEYDKPTGEQPLGPFHCHTSPNFLCTGWAVCHERSGRGKELMALRVLASVTGELVPLPDTTVPLFASGAAAAEHGLRDIHRPGRKALAAMRKIERSRLRKATQKWPVA